MLTEGVSDDLLLRAGSRVYAGEVLVQQHVYAARTGRGWEVLAQYNLPREEGRAPTVTARCAERAQQLPWRKRSAQNSERRGCEEDAIGQTRRPVFSTDGAGADTLLLKLSPAGRETSMKVLRIATSCGQGGRHSRAPLSSGKSSVYERSPPSHDMSRNTSRVPNTAP